jgi:hypothetical protein
MRHLSAAAVVVVIVLVTLESAALACSCKPPQDLPTRFETYDAIFWGTVQDVQTSPTSETRLHATTSVHKVFKGNLDDEVTVTTNRHATACGMHLEEGASYLLYAYASSDGLRVSKCGRNVRADHQPIWPSVRDLSQVRPEAGTDIVGMNARSKHIEPRTRRAAQRARSRLLATGQEKASDALAECMGPIDYLPRDITVKLDLDVHPTGDYVATRAGVGRSADVPKKRVERFVSCLIEQVNAGDDFAAFPGGSLRLRHRYSRRKNDANWSVDQALRSGRSARSLGTVDVLSQVPDRMAPSKLAWEIYELSDLVDAGLDLAVPVNRDRIVKLARLHHEAGQCDEAVEVLERLSSFDEHREDADNIQMDCFVEQGQYRRAFEIAKRLVDGETTSISADVVLHDLLAYAVERLEDADSDAQLPLGDGDISFASHWLDDPGLGRLRRHRGADALLSLIEARDFHDSPLVLEAAGDLLARTGGPLVDARPEAAARAYLRAAGQVEGEAAEAYRHLAESVLDDPERADEVEAKLGSSLREAREASQRRNAKDEAAYKEKLSRLDGPDEEPQPAAEKGRDEAIDSQPAAEASPEQTGEDADEEPGGSLFLVFGLALGFVALMLAGASFFAKDDP